jgi:hypothetical protein
MANSRLGWTAAVTRLAAPDRSFSRSGHSEAPQRPEAVGQTWPEAIGPVTCAQPSETDADAEYELWQLPIQTRSSLAPARVSIYKFFLASAPATVRQLRN